MPSTSHLAQLQDTQHENVHHVDQKVEEGNSAGQLLIDTNSSDDVPVQNTQHESAEQLSVLESSFQNEGKQVRLYYGTRNWYITLNAVHDIHLHTLF